MTAKEFLLSSDMGFDEVKLICDNWKGYKVYDTYMSDGSCPVVGLPLMILEKDGKFRWTDSKECFEVLEFVYPRDKDEE